MENLKQATNQAGPSVFPEPWACDWGEDGFGLWMGFQFKGVRQVLRWVEPGIFSMGSPGDELERDEDEIQHEVRLTRGFWMGETVCTQALWEAVTGKTPSHFKGVGRPVDSVSWEDCREFMERINRAMPGLELDFPTEAQWEYACRSRVEVVSGIYTPFNVGSTLTTDQANYDGDHPYADGEKGVDRGKTVPVKEFSPNDRGLYGMHGNVLEWCRDWYGAYPKDTMVDPVGPDDGADRVLRGGSWFDFAGYCRSASRRWNEPGDRLDLIGFRFSRGQTGKG